MRSRGTTAGSALSAAVGLVLLAVGCSGTASAGKPVTDTQGSGTAGPVVLSPATPMGASDEFRAFLQNVRTLSHGSIQISAEFDAHHEEGPDFEEQLLGDVRSGRATWPHSAVGSSTSVGPLPSPP